MSWLQKLSAAFERERAISKVTSNWTQLATVTNEGTPSVRTVVMRGLVDRSFGAEKQPRYFTNEQQLATKQDTPYLAFCTDIRSAKLHGRRWKQDAELCWMMNNIGKQFRLTGVLYAIPHIGIEVSLPELTAQDPKAAWETVRINVKNQLNQHLLTTFCGPTPGQVVQGSKAEYVYDAKTCDENCCLLVLDVEHVDFLDLDTSQRIEWLLSEDQRWIEQTLYP